MFTNKASGSLVTKADLRSIAILMAIAAVLGIYMIARTVLIARDGVCYINYAKAMAVDPTGVIRDCSDYAPEAYTPGYPFLILVTHKLLSNIYHGSDLFAWIYSAQAAALLFRVLSLIPLYLIGREFVGSKSSFWALLILIFLPYPARFASDALRDWPYIFFLAWGFLFLIHAVNRRSWRMYLLAGLAAGLGFLVRPFCGQIIVYGFAWLVLEAMRLKSENAITKTRLIACAVSLMIGFSLIATPYLKVKGQLLPPSTKRILKNFIRYEDPAEAEQGSTSLPVRTIKGSMAIAMDFTENLMYYFLPFLIIGLCDFFRRKPQTPLHFLLKAFFGLNLAAVTVRCLGDPRLVSDNRYVLALTVFSIFFLPVGLRKFAEKIEALRSNKSNVDELSPTKVQRCFVVLVLIGIVICMPKLLRPIRIEKSNFLSVAKWLDENTAKDDFLIVSDSRFGFYADRKSWKIGILLTGEYVIAGPGRKVIKFRKGQWDKQVWQRLGDDFKYVVAKVRKDEILSDDLVELWSDFVSTKSKSSRVVIYKRN